MTDPLPERSHTDEPDCWCEPVIEYTTASGTEVWVHRDLKGGTVAPVEVIAEAIAWAAEDED